LRSVASKSELPQPCHRARVCPACGSQGALLHRRVTDRLHGVPGVWQTCRCLGSPCDLVWLDPRPTESEIPSFYARYETHEDADEIDGRVGPRRWYPSPVAARARRQRDLEILPAGVTGSSVLEVGCGNGRNLVRLRSLGWTVFGQDIDPEAVRSARAEGLEVTSDPLALAEFPISAFDVVLLSHVIEHVLEPADLLSLSAGRLRPGGIVVVFTPNARSLSHRLFRSKWRGLEAPRHTQVFGPESLGAALRAASFTEVSVRTTSSSDGYMAGRSIIPSSGSIPARSRLIRMTVAVVGQLLSDVFANDSAARFGGELIATATRPAGSGAVDESPFVCESCPVP
jgi:SAM-dependent methyltransferase